MYSEKLRICNIQRFCVHDGPGIRTTVFLKGCNLVCPWCSNPECQDYEIQDYVNKDKFGNIENGHYGYDIMLADLERILLRDKVYYGNNGGVTFSGGEPLLQLSNYAAILNSLREDNISCAVETALYVNNDIVKQALDLFNLFIVDLKTGSADFAKVVLKSIKYNTYINNLEYLSSQKKIWIRFPAIQDYTLKKENVNSVCNILREIKFEKFQILIGHNLGAPKYRNLKKDYKPIKDADLSYLLSQCKEYDIKFEILKV